MGVTIVETAEPDPPAEVTDTPEPAGEQIETIADATVEIAQIEANRDVTIAEIQAETEKETIASINETVSEDRDEWRQNIEARMEAAEVMSREILSTLQTLTPPSPPSPPENPENPEAMPESREAPEPLPVKKRQHHRLI